MKNASCPADFIEWIEKIGVVSALDFVLMASNDEAKVDGSIIDAAKSGSVKLDEIKYQIAVKKAWRLCREVVDREEAEKKARLVAGVVDDEKLPEGVTKTLEDAWAARHTFPIPIARLLTEGLQARLYRETHKSSPRFNVLMLEAIRTQACTEKKSGTSFTFTPGMMVKSEEVIADQVGGHYELWLRVRALYTTVAYICIDKPAWFSFADAELMSDTVIEFLHRRYDGSRAPLDFFIKAYIAMSQGFAEQVKNENRTLSQVVRAKTEWTGLWTWSIHEVRRAPTLPWLAPP